MKDIYIFKSHLFGGEGYAPFLFAFKSMETCVKRYLNLSNIYSEVKDVQPIYSMFISKETCIVKFFIRPTDGHTLKVIQIDHFFHLSY